MHQKNRFVTNSTLKILYLLPLDDKEKGGMTAITKMFYEVGFFENKNIRHFNTIFKSGESNFTRFFESLFHKVRFIKLLIQFRPDITFVMTSAYWGFFDKAVYCLIARCFGVKSMLNQVGDFADFYEESKWKSYCIRLALKFPNSVIIGSVFWNRYFSSHFPDLFIQSVVNPVDCNRFYKNSISEGQKIKIVSISGIIVPKGIIELVEVIKQVCERSNNFVFVIMGGGEKLEWVRTELKAESEKGQVDIKGFVSDDEKIIEFSTADLFIMLSHNEVIPISILEAMSASLPIISTDVGGIPDIVIEDANGFLFPRKSVTPVVNKLLDLADKREYLKNMGLISKSIVEKDYDVFQVLEKHILLAEELMKR
ncbi:MAG: glycosyltransferase [Sediminibacterium sp.]|nr:glycosyltransferase [Sediminibacterium sp.]